MNVIKRPENGKNFVEYSTKGTKISFSDGEITADLQKKERDDDVKIDVCMDNTGGLIFGTSGARIYVAQIFIPARRYTDVEVDNPDYNPEDETSQKKIIEQQPIPFSMDNVELTLFEEV
ncbi:MAG: hypothetical protein IJ733_21425 [Lachnospiraceae bacterium]|nr:hypothetical protein [Lachnospiraceae bacterium]